MPVLIGPRPWPQASRASILVRFLSKLFAWLAPREDGGRSEPRLQPGPSLQERRVDAAELEVVHHLAQQA